ncbi:MAG TPA: FAD-dependent monooxygenase [Burkholderiales bacterium]|nr:FAD-dependent monooxygenase [Burkholderiales bacterium]
MTERATDVLIVGAGPVGLALAVELGQRSVRSIVVEQSDRVGLKPRAKLTNVRSRELLRRWGIAEALARASPLPPDYPANIVFATRLNGHTLARFEGAFNCARIRNDLYSEPGQWVPQYTLEEVLRQHAARLPGVQIRFNCRLEKITQDETGVTAKVDDAESGARDTLRATYLVGADGARSTVRALLGIGMQGEGALAPNLNMVFRAPALAGMHDKGAAIMYWMVNRELPAYFGPLDREGLWFLIAPRLPGGMNPGDSDAREVVYRSSGLRFPLEIVHVDPWTAHRLIAERYGTGRVFLAGDACHLHPPSGGHGMNMGIADATDLGWKLAATLQGWGGPHLLGTYETERKPQHLRVIREAVENYELTGDRLAREGIEQPGAEGERVRKEVGEIILKGKAHEFHSLGVILGGCYRDSPAIIPDGTRPPAETITEYHPSACPGCLAPHFWLPDGTSLYDHFGAGFTLLAALDTPSAETSRLERAAEARGVPIKIFQLADPRFPELYQARLALVRPDQHVAWRGGGLPQDCLALIDRVRGGP